MPKQKPRPFKLNAAIVNFAAAIAAVSGLLCILLSGLLILNYWQVSTLDPLNLPEMEAWRGRITAAPESREEIIETLQTMDLLARGTFFTSQRMLRTGGLLALSCAMVCLLAMRLAANYAARPPLPAPGQPRQEFWFAKSRARELLVFMGGLWLLFALLAAGFTRLEIPAPGQELIAGEEADASPAASEITLPGWDTVQRQWPNFRGPGGNGIAYHTTAPIQWNVESGENVIWKVEPPLPGFNSPVVWEDRIYLSGADDTRREVFCFSADTGELLWQTAVGARVPPGFELPKVMEDTGYAAPSVATQGDVVCALFGTGHLACLNRDGTVRWEKFLGVPDNHYGHSSSLIIFEHLLLVQYDQRTNAALYAFDLRTGEEAWKQERTHISWATPLLAGMPDHPRLALVSTKNLDVYDPREGTRLWSLECLTGEVGPSPAFGAGLFFVANDYADASAVRPPGEETDQPEIAWQFYESLPDVSSPLATETFFYLATSRGEIICLQPKDGEIVWVQEFENAFYASPVLVGDRIYIPDKEGVMFIFKNDDSYQEIAALPLGEPVVSTSAFMDKRLYVRTLTALICIGES